MQLSSLTEENTDKNVAHARTRRSTNDNEDKDAYNLSDPTERKMFFQSVYVFRNDLCIGNIARNIHRGLQTENISRSSYDVC